MLHLRSSTRMTSLSMRALIRTLSLYPGVKSITSETLQTWINNPVSKRPLVLLDVRASEEYQVSHMKYAINVDQDADDIPETVQMLMEKYPAAEEIQTVCYCSVGYRSAKYVAGINRLQKKGLQVNITPYSLKGSIFKWANEGRPMVDGKGNPTIKAHPYSAFFGKFLKANIRGPLTKAV